MIQRSLSSALLHRFLLAFIVVIVGILLTRAVSEHANAHERAQADLNAIADTFATAAASTIWDYQSELLLAIVRGIGNNPIVEAVTITDSSGNTLAHWQASEGAPVKTTIQAIRELRRDKSTGDTRPLGTMTISSSEDRVIANLKQILLQAAIWNAVLLLFLLCLLWYLIQRLVARPLTQFSQAVNLLPADDYSQKIELQPVQVKEIASLQNSFIGLMDQVGKSHQQISRHNAELGLRVAARTAELSEQAQHTRTVLDHILDAVITIDDQGLIQSFNPAAESIFGYAASEIVGREVKVLLPDSTESTTGGVLMSYRLAYASDSNDASRELEGLRKDGSRFAMELKVSEIKRPGHSVYVAMARDITERKRIERMKSEFVSTVSHELRTPLTSISGALGLLAGGVAGALSEPAAQMIDIARRNSLQLEALINDLLDMEKLVAGKMRFDIERLELAPLIHEVIESMALYDTARNVKILSLEPIPEVRVAVDRQRLLQALRNFLSNAVKFSPESGTVEVSAVLVGDLVRINVQDHGEGVPEAFRASIFQKFSQADSTDTRQKGGTGLGLAITREIAEQMHGSVGFDSIPGQGATFWLVLPVQYDE